MITRVAKREVNKAKAPALVDALVEQVPGLRARIKENDFFDSDTVIVTGSSTAEVRVLSNRVATRDRFMRDKIAASLPDYHGLIDARDGYPWYFIILSHPGSRPLKDWTDVTPAAARPTCLVHYLVLPATGRCDDC
jgi:hypothetical protein